MENYLYFAESDVETGADYASEAVTIPASSYLYADPTSPTITDFYFKSVLGRDYGMQKISLGHASNINKSVIKAVLECVNANPHSGGFVIVANSNVAAVSTGAEYSPALQDLVTTVNISESNTGTNPGRKGYQMPAKDWGGATTALSGSITLAANTNYHSIAGNVAAAIPSAAATSKGAWITVMYTTVITAGNTHVFTSNAGDASYAAGSSVTRVGGSIASGVDICNGTNDNILTIDGDTNGDGGIGSFIRFVNTSGKAGGWAVEAMILNQGDGTGAMAAATAFS